MDINGVFWHLFNNDISAIQPLHGQEITEQRGVDGNQGNDVEMNIVMNNQHDVGNSSGINKKRKKQSKVWEEMTKFTGSDGRDWAKCNYCEKTFDGSSKKGTTHLKNHLDRCRPKTSNGGEDAGKSMDQTTNLTSSIAIEEKPVTDLIKNCFENPIHGYWDPSVVNSRKAEIHQVYGEEKEKLLRVFKELSCCFNLKIEELRGWYVLRVCYIDNNWEQKQKIISVHDVIEDGEVDHNYQNLVKILIESCLDLKIDGNIHYITYHCHPGSDNFVRGDHEDVVGEITSRFGQRDNPLPCVEVLFSFDALSLIYYNFEKKFTKWLWNTFGGIRKCINYVNSTRSNRRSLRIAAGKAKSMGKKVNISLSFPISASYFADFDGAVSYKAAFRELESIDSDFKSRSINLTKKRWNDANAICRDYKELKASMNSFCKGGYATANEYFPKFCDLYKKILSLKRTQFDEKTSTAIKKLASTLKKYQLVLVIAVVLDPRFKMDIVQLWYNNMYGSRADYYFKKIMSDFTDVYNEYAKVSEFQSEDATRSSYLDGMGRPCTSSHNILIPHKLSELERYLSDPKFPSIKKFDILVWRRAYTPVFPTLARMARDFLISSL